MTFTAAQLELARAAAAALTARRVAEDIACGYHYHADRRHLAYKSIEGDIASGYTADLAATLAEHTRRYVSADTATAAIALTAPPASVRDFRSELLADTAIATAWLYEHKRDIATTAEIEASPAEWGEAIADISDMLKDLTDNHHQERQHNENQ